MGYRLNVRKDAFDPRDHVVAPNASASAVVVRFRKQVPYLKDQGAEGSCTAHAGTEHFEFVVRRYKSDVPLLYPRNSIRLSPNFQYVQERIAEGSFNSDAGADSRTIFKVLTSVGCCLESSDPYGPDTLYKLPAPVQVAEASKFKFGAYHRILDVDTAKTVLQSGYSFTVGMPLFKSFEGDYTSRTGFVEQPSGSSIGGHEMHVIGCDDTKFSGTGAFEVQNSWGEEWGDNGYCWVPYSYFAAIEGEYDFWVGHFGKPWVPKAA